MEYHAEERNTIDLLDKYINSHEGGRLTLTFAEGDVYVCDLFCAYEADNGLALDDPDYDEFYEIAFLIRETLVDGPNKEEGYGTVLLNYKHFPALITAEDGAEIYHQEGSVG